MTAVWRCCTLMPRISSSAESGRKRPATRIPISHRIPNSRPGRARAAGNDPAFRKFCEFLGMAELVSDPRFATNAARLVNRDALTDALSARFADEDGHELTRRMLVIGLPAGPVLYVDEAMAAGHTAHRKMVTELGA